MEKEYGLIITAIGKAKMANAQVTQTKLNIVSFAVGDAEYYVPIETDTALRNEVYRGVVTKYEIDTQKPNRIIVHTRIPAEVGPFYIREVGLFDDAGDLIAVGAISESHKSTPEQGVSKELLLRHLMDVSNADTINLLIDESINYAPYDYVNQEVIKISETMDQNVAEISQQLSNIKKTMMFIDAVEDFGVKNDGTDTYAELRALSEFVSGKNGVFINFKPGNYKIDQYVKQFTNNIFDITYYNIDGLTIIGYGAFFDIKGDFNRNTDNDKSVIPFKIQRCKNVLLEGFKLTGNVDKMTRKVGLGENQSHGIGIYGSKNVSLFNLESSYFATDGIYLAEDKANLHEGLLGSNLITENVTGENVTCQYNSRQGISITQSKTIKFVKSKFNYTGYHGGLYGGSLPMAGVDIEPNFYVALNPDVVEDDTKDIIFEQCEFKFNKGSQIATWGTNYCENVKFINCEIESASDSELAVVSFATLLGVMQDCLVKITNGGYIQTYDGTSRSHVTFKNNKVSSNGKALKTTNPSASSSSIIVENTFESTHTTPYAGLFIELSGVDNVFDNNKIFIPSAVVADSAVLQDIISLNVRHVANNQYNTDVTGVGFNILYNDTKIVRDEIYKPEFSRFRPKGGLQTRNLPYAKGLTNLGDRAIIHDNMDKTRLYSIDFGDAPPTAKGTNDGYTVASVRLSNNVDSPFVGWQCYWASTSTSAWRPIQHGRYVTSIDVVPTFIGQEALVGGKFYKAIGMASPSDWKQITN